MKYILLIHQGTTPVPGTDAWETLSDDEKNGVYAAYKALNETPGVTPGLQMQGPETATTVRVQDGRTLTTDGPFVDIKEALGGYCFFEADDLDAAIELASRSRPPAWAAPSRCGRSPSGRDPREHLPRPMGPRSRCADWLPRRFRPRRGSRAERFAIAAERWPRAACRRTRAAG